MTMPVIALTVGRQNHATPRREVQTVTMGCDIDYLTAVIRAGGVPVLLPAIAEAEAIRAVLAVADGVLLTGGGDIESYRFGQEPHPATYYQDPYRDACEFEVVRQATALGLPIFGICRGIQVINVALGGTLIQDIPSQVNHPVKHYSQGLVPELLHAITIEPDSLLSRLFGGTTTTRVNSWHHQAIDVVGNGLRVTARAKDGVIEAVESEDGMIFAVQYHPEECVEPYPHFLPHFEWLAQAAARRKAETA